MAFYDNPTVGTTGTDGDDTFSFTHPVPYQPAWTLIASAGGGFDTLIYDVGVRGQYRFRLAGDQISGSVFHGGEGGSVAFEEFEKIEVTGSSGSDSFVFDISGTTDSSNIKVDGGGGGDGLSLEVTTGADFTFIVNGDTISSSVGTFSNFAAFGLYLSYGDDTVTTGDGNDVIYIGFAVNLYGAGTDVVHTGGGDDIVYVTSDGGTFDGGTGFDTLRYSQSNNDVFRLGLARDGTITTTLPGSYMSFERFILQLGNGDDGVITGDGNDSITGFGGDDYIQTGGGDDILRGGSGVNTLIGGSGNDTYFVDNATDILVEEANGGYDTVYTSLSYSLGIGSQLEAIMSTAGQAVTLTGNELDNSLTGGNGDDILIGRAGADILDGGEGTDYVSYEGDGGPVFVNLTLGQGFTNTSFGDTYTDIANVIGTDFDDFIIGDPNLNQLDGGAGSDTIIGGIGGDVLIGGSGNDLLSYEDNSGVVFVNLLTGLGYNNAAEGDTLSGFENVIGGLFDDTLIGDDGANRLDGAKGADTLVGNGGADTFVFANLPNWPSPYFHPNANYNIDTILDFVSGEDKLEITASVFVGGLATGTLPADQFVLGTGATDADDRFIYDQTTGKLYFDEDGTGFRAQQLMAIFPNHDAIAATDFVIV